MIMYNKNKAESDSPIIAHIFPAFELLYEAWYLARLVSYNALSVLLRDKAMIPIIKPGIPHNQQVTIDNIPKTRTAVELGTAC